MYGLLNYKDLIRRSIHLSAIDWDCVDQNFRKLVRDKSGELTFEEFKKIIPAKNVHTIVYNKSYIF